MQKHRHSRGIALIIVLGSLVFLTALVLAFIARVNSELKVSKIYAEGSGTGSLAQSAVNLVMAEISTATRGRGSSNNTLCWASQPGMIRTYDTTGSPDHYYKLYSSDRMIGKGGFDPNKASEAVPQDWFDKKALFTDLNQPVQKNGKELYPIIDGNSLQLISGMMTYDANGDGKADVDGFGVSVAPTGGKKPNPVPMPVRWLYVLDDGRVVSPQEEGEKMNRVKIEGGSQNSIVGRIAFWTDDESCKVNINTASEGSYSDMPRTSGPDDTLLAANQPVNHEYQRYPGHPATTSLSPILGDGLTAEQIYQLIPYVGTGGSKGGTVQTTQLGTGQTPPPVVTDSDRLYATADEFFFSQSSAGDRRKLNSSSAMTPELISRLRFFLTPFSRSPDVNLFNKPRVSIWPVALTEDDSSRTVFDRLMAFCCTMNPKGLIPHRFYFQRDDSTSPTHDLPTEGTVSGLGRNRMLLEYLRSLMLQKVPGFGGSFKDKYPVDTDQILTEIFDYIRSTNLADQSLKKPFTSAVNADQSGLGQVIPIEDTKTNTRGFGRFRTVQSAGLIFIANVDGDVPASQVSSSGAALGTPVPAGNVRMQAAFLISLYDPSVGSIFNYPNFKVDVSGLDQFQWNGTAMGFPAASNMTQASYADMNNFYGDQLGFTQLILPLKNAYPLVSTSLDIAKAAGSFAFTGADVTIKMQSPQGVTLQTVVLRFPNGTFPLPSLAPNNIFSKKAGDGPYNMRYFVYSGAGSLGGRFKTQSGLNPATWITDYDVVRTVVATPGDMRLIASQKNTPLPGTAQYPFAANAKYNVVATPVKGAHHFWDGDSRPYYGAAGGRLVRALSYTKYAVSINDNAMVLSAPWKGGLVTYSVASDVPIDGVALGKSTAFATGDILGDWDNGPYCIRDGPYINKPDEGDMGDPTTIPYNWIQRTGSFALSAPLFTPNRLVSSAGMFGSLPTGVISGKPWQTLHFRPGPTGHPGLGSPTPGVPPYTTIPDHLMLDLFHMPVVEPYAISEPLSTAGRVNMNYQMIPFTYIKRDVGIRAVLKSEKMISIPDAQAGKYKITFAPFITNSTRLSISATETLKGFETRFNAHDIFRSASEICDIHLVPEGSTYNQMAIYWNTNRLTGDNSREKPYANIYPRLTTKSNTFTVHYRVQTLKKVKGTPANEWIEESDQIVGETRGSQTLERYVDPNDSKLESIDFASPDNEKLLGDYYKFRILSSSLFSP